MTQPESRTQTQSTENAAKTPGPRFVVKQLRVDRAAVFIDGGYLDKLLREDFPGTHIDYRKLLGELSRGGREVFRANYYTALSYQSNPPTLDEEDRREAQVGFLSCLRRIPGFRVCLGKLERRDTREGFEYRQKRVDVMLAIDVARLAMNGQVSELILFAGDSDFVPLLDLARELGIKVRLFHSKDPRHCHRDLYEAADARTPIDEALLAKVRHERSHHGSWARPVLPGNAPGSSLRESA